MGGTAGLTAAALMQYRADSGRVLLTDKFTDHAEEGAEKILGESVAIARATKKYAVQKAKDELGQHNR